jgi:Fe-S oxidoreductase
MYSPKDIIDAVAANVRKTRGPFGIPKWMDNTWWKKMPLRREGDALLFTGLMYQFNPYIEKSTHFLEKFEDTGFGGLLSRSAKFMPSRLSGVGLAMMTPGKEKKRANKILQDIAALLTRSNVDFYYKPKLDNYSGILLYDLGDQESFIKHAKYVAEKLKKAGVRKIITVDPHTTYALKVLYPEYTGETFDVKAYFELINLKPNNGTGTHVTLHDPCFYGRYLELSDAPRKVLADIGITVDEVRNSRTFTSCCGGPAESVSPALSKEVMERRVDELQSTRASIVAMCPICLGNLRKSGADVEDLSSVIARHTS